MKNIQVNALGTVKIHRYCTVGTKHLPGHKNVTNNGHSSTGCIVCNNKSSISHPIPP